MTDETNDIVVAGVDVSTVFNNILSGLETSVFTIVGFVLASFMPKFLALTANDLLVIGNNFRLFLTAIGNGTAWGSALADMLTEDWNDVEESAKMAATDFADAVATALENAGLLPQGK